MKIVFASSNNGKIKELENLIKPFDIQLISQKDLNVSDIEETGETFIENAILKARHACTITRMPAIADDSGLIVDALAGEPGIYSARYAGESANSTDNIKKLLDKLKEIPENKRNAAFYCALVYMEHERDPTPLICEGIWYGKILFNPQGTMGFGYDPVFFDSKENCSAAELPLARKNIVSHRGQALKLLIQKFREKHEGFKS